jgi:transposase
MYDLRDDQWEKIKDSLPGKKGDPGRTAENNRKFISAVMWIARNGAGWRAFPLNMANGLTFTSDFYAGLKQGSGR